MIAGRAMSQRADDIVGLVAITADAGNPQGRQRIYDQRNLGSEVLGGLLRNQAACTETVRLVGGDGVNPKSRPPVVVPAGDQMCWAMCGDQGCDHVQKPPDGIGRRLVGAASLVWHAIEGAEVQGGRVQKHQALGHRTPRVQTRSLRAGRKPFCLSVEGRTLNPVGR